MRIVEVPNKKNIMIKGVKVDNDGVIDTDLPINWYGHFSLIVGSPGSGKTSLLQSLVSSKKFKSYRGRFDRVYLLSGSLNTLPEKFLEKIHPERLKPSLDELESIIADIINSDDKTLIIIDDLLADLKNKEFLKSLQRIAFNRRHIGGGISMMLISQKISLVPLSLRTVIDSIYFFNASSKQKKERERLYEDYINEFDKEDFNTFLNSIFEDEPNHCFLLIDKRNGKYYKRFNELKVYDD